MDLYEEAVAARGKALIFEGAREGEVAGLSRAFATSGAEGYWRWLLEHDKEREKRGEYVSPMDFAIHYAQLGETAQAFEWLEKAYEARDLALLKVDPYFDPLRDDPRFTDLLRRMNLEP